MISDCPTSLTGAIETLDIGDPFDCATDVGPVIDEAALDALEAHACSATPAN